MYRERKLLEPLEAWARKVSLSKLCQGKISQSPFALYLDDLKDY